MEDFQDELIQFFNEQQSNYTFLLHRTKNLATAASILENGLYFEENILKVTDQVSPDVGRSLIGNKLFFGSYGEHIIIIAIPKKLKLNLQEIVEKVDERDSGDTPLDDKTYMEFNELYHLPAKYIFGYNHNLSRKIRYNKKFEFFANNLDKLP